jgi:periplasmic protein CpxP/Spy
MNGRTVTNRVLRSAIVAAVVAPLVVISAAFAQPGGGHRRGELGAGPGPGMGMGMGMGPFEGLRMLRELDLSDDQRQQVKDVLEKARETGVQKQLMDSRKALQDAVESDTIDEENLHNLADQVGVAEGNAAVERAHIRQQILQILTDEQRQELESMKAEAKQRMEERRQRFEQRLKERANKGAKSL